LVINQKNDFSAKAIDKWQGPRRPAAQLFENETPERREMLGICATMAFVVKDDRCNTG
jgi:hypothetical protein